VNSRQLGRSLDPLPGESLHGFLLRLSFRLHLAPIRLARMAGLLTNPNASVISRWLLLGRLNVDAFAAFTRLSEPEAAGLTLAPWIDRYPPVARTMRRTPATADEWLLCPTRRYCPRCLAGDGSRTQTELGGCWKSIWLLPITYACLEHQIMLQHGCPNSDRMSHGDTVLINHASIGDLHPAQCRQPQPGTPSRGRRRPACAARLDEDHTADTPVTSEALGLQQRLIKVLDPGHPAEDAGFLTAELRVITAMLGLCWPASADLVALEYRTVIADHFSPLADPGTRQAVDRPPTSPMATAGLLTAANQLREDPERQALLINQLRRSWDGRPSVAPWVRVFTRHKPSCSPQFQQVFEPATRSFTRISGSHSAKAPARSGGYRAEHIPAFLEHEWFEEHLQPMGCHGSMARLVRRFAAVILVQWAAGGSLGTAAYYLGINPRGYQYAPSADLSRWLTDLGPERFAHALRELAEHLDSEDHLIDYQHRRQALGAWALTPQDWDDITTDLPPVPGPIQPVLDDRKRQEASAFIWAYVTRGEHRFAPRPIEAAQPPQIRQYWQQRHGATGYQLGRPDPGKHYATLRALLINHADDLARAIDVDRNRQAVAETVARF
jgi:hypothetical protein